MRIRWELVIVNSYTQAPPVNGRAHTPTNVENSPFNVPENPETATVHDRPRTRFLCPQMPNNTVLASISPPISPRIPCPSRAEAGGIGLLSWVWGGERQFSLRKEFLRNAQERTPGLRAREGSCWATWSALRSCGLPPPLRTANLALDYKI